MKKKVDIHKLINRLILFISLGIVAHISFVLYTTEKDIAAKLGQIEYYYFALIVLLMLVPWIGYAFRVRMWSLFLGEKITYAEALRVVITADVASALSPTAVGGAPFKAALLLKKGFSSGKVGFLLTWGVIEDTIFYVSGFICAIIFSSGILERLYSNITSFLSDNIVWIGWVFFALLIYLIMKKTGIIPKSIGFSKLIPQKFRTGYLKLVVKSRQSYDELRQSFMYVLNAGKLRMLLGITILYVQWFAKFSILIVILYALDIDFDALQIYVRQWIIWITMLFIPTPGASGGAEASFLLIFGKSIPPDIVNLIVSVWRFFTYYLVLLTAVLIYQTLSFTSGKITELEIETPQDDTISKNSMEGEK